MRTPIDAAAVRHEPAGLPGQLSPRERTLLRLVASGRTNREIATELFLAEKTVRNQLSLVFAKLGVSRRAQAAAFAVRHGIAGDDA